MDELQLLRRYAATKDPLAFAELVRRHSDWVYCSARRQTRDAHLAEDVTQAVFWALAQKAGRLARGVVLPAWLLRATQCAAAMANRSEAPRKRHEPQAAAMAEQQRQDMDEQQWEQLAPVLDELVGKLGKKDQLAILLRFYQQKSFAEVAQELGTSEAAAKMRVSRAVEKLRRLSEGKGLAVGAAALASGLFANTTQAAPAALAGTIISTAAGATAAPTVLTLAKGAIQMLNLAKLKLVGGISAVAALGTGLSIGVAQLAQARDPHPAVVAAPASTTSQPATAQSISLSGQILSPDGQPVPGVKLWLCQQDPKSGVRQVLRTATTTDTGALEIALTDEQAARPLFLLADAPGYGLSGEWLDAGEPVQLHLLPATELRLPLIGPDDKPAVGVRVLFTMLVSPDTPPSYWLLPEPIPQQFAVTTGPDGVATLPRLPRGFRIQPQMDDDRFAQFTHKNRIQLSTEPVTNNPPLHLLPAATVEGKIVYGPTAEPAEGIRVAAQGTGAYAGWAEAKTDAQGRYTLKRLPPGHFNVALDLKGPVGEAWTAVAHEDVALAPGQEVKDKDFTLIKGALITGKIAAQDNGEPAADVSVGIYGPAHPQSSAWVQGTHTDKDGVYRLRVPPGRQRLYISGWVPPTLDDPGRMQREIDVREGQELTIDFPLLRPPPAEPVSGQVLDADGKPAANATVFIDLLRRHMGQQTSVKADQDGGFRIDGAIVSGGANLSAKRGRQTTAKLLRVKGGEEVTLNLFRDPTASISGTVTDEQGQPIARAEVTHQVLRSMGNLVSMGMEHKTITDEQGRYRLEKLRLDSGGTYTVEAAAKGFGAESQEVKDLTPGETRTLPALALRPATEVIEGQVVDEAGSGVAGAMVILNRTGKTRSQSLVTDQTGQFHFEVVEGETVTLYARSDEGGQAPSVRAKAGTKDLRLRWQPPQTKPKAS